jgi:DNA-directed RNA polymerase subunit RPC12/RpoP
MKQNEIVCPHCGNDDERMIELLSPGKGNMPSSYVCQVCSKFFLVKGKLNARQA